MKIMIASYMTPQASHRYNFFHKVVGCACKPRWGRHRAFPTLQLGVTPDGLL